ncbi:MAG: 3'-5' exonuclease [Deltaproteobacteria bacterium]|nr:3'-5' exonuclease [Deltaproteobacteria bacterium]
MNTASVVTKPGVEASLQRPPVLRTLVFLDLETTGLDPQRDEIIEVAAMRVDPTSLAVEAWMDTRVAPSALVVLDPEAAALNGFKAEDWQDAPGLERVLPALARFLEGCIIVGHNPAFDWAFLQAGFRRLGIRPPEVGHHLVDTASLAWPLLRHGFIQSLSLAALCDHYGISNAGAHHALEDVVRTYRVFLRLLRAEGNAAVVEGGGVQ